MSYVQDKGEIAALLDSPVFTRLLGIQSREQFLSLTKDESGQLGQYFENPWDDENMTAGVKLVSTGNSSFYGQTVYVAKLYGENEAPFRVVYSEVVAWGTEMDPELKVGDFKTLGEALDMMIETHQKGNVQLNVIQENEATGLYEKGQASIQVPNAPVGTKDDKVLHARFDKAVEASVENWAKEPEPEVVESGFEVPVATRRTHGGDVSPSF